MSDFKLSSLLDEDGDEIAAPAVSVPSRKPPPDREVPILLDAMRGCLEDDIQLARWAEIKVPRRGTVLELAISAYNREDLPTIEWIVRNYCPSQME